MKSMMIFGFGHYGKLFYEYVNEYRNDYKVVAILDNYISELECELSIPILCPNNVYHVPYDSIVITPKSGSLISAMKEQLTSGGVPESKIVALFENVNLLYDFLSSPVNFYYDEDSDIRINWLRQYALYVEEVGIKGDVAECGVYRGDFSYFINKFFPSRRCYLFDTFDGFDDGDLDRERGFNNPHFNNSFFSTQNIFKDKYNLEEIVKRKMPFPLMCEIRRGYFPETAKDLFGKFCFVNLDMDLYVPMLEGLKLFYPLMTSSGIMLLHDYFNDFLPGVRRAVSDYEKIMNLEMKKIPIGDDSSIAILK